MTANAGSGLLELELAAYLSLRKWGKVQRCVLFALVHIFADLALLPEFQVRYRFKFPSKELQRASWTQYTSVDTLPIYLYLETVRGVLERVLACTIIRFSFLLRCR